MMPMCNIMKGEVFGYPNKRIMTSIFIRDHLNEVGEDFPNSINRELHKVKYMLGHKKTNILNMYRYVFALKQLGMIYLKRIEKMHPPKGCIKERHYYAIVPGKEDDPRWFEVQHSLWSSYARRFSDFPQ